jgi:hypothetical protein
VGVAAPEGTVTGGGYFASSGSSVQDDFVTGIRRTLTLSVPQNNTWLDWLTRPALELRPFTGIKFGNTTEWCPQGRFTVKAKPRNLRPGLLSLKANDFWDRVPDAEFPGPRSYGGQAFEIRGLIRQFISETGDYTVIERSTSTAVASQIYVWEEGRQKAITDLCDSIGATAYFDREGNPVVEDWAPQPQVLTLADNLIDVSANVDTTKVYNTVSARSSAQGVVFDPVVVSITDPFHPAHRANLGRDVVKVFASPLLLTPEQAGLAAYTILYKHSAPSRTLTLSIVPNPALDAGDVVTVNWPGGPDQLRIQTITHPLGGGGQQITAMQSGAPLNDN